MKVTKPGQPNPGRTMVGTCPKCAAEVECDEDEAKVFPYAWSVDCPTEGCGFYIPIEFKKVEETGASGRRTTHEVLKERRNNGCCNRYADNMACDCLNEAVKCPECGDSGYAVHPQNGANRNSRRCSRGCPVRCSICRDPDCDNPGGQH